MQNFVMHTRLAPEAFRYPRSLEERERRVMNRIRTDCPSVRWIGSYVVLGPCDYLDLFEAPDIETAVKVSAIVRTFGNATTEIWPVTPWVRFKEIMRGLPAEADWHATMTDEERSQLAHAGKS